MAKRYTLILSEEQADILGFALSTARREQERDGRHHASKAKAARREHGAESKAQRLDEAAEGCRDRVRRLDELAYLIDTCPVAEA